MDNAVTAAQVIDPGVASGLLDYGLLGLLLLMSLGLNGFMFRHILRLMELRIDETRTNAERMHANANMLDRAISLVDRLGVPRA